MTQAGVLVNLAVQHMLAAARFSREVGKLEGEHAGEQLGPFWDSIFHPAIGCILTVVGCSRQDKRCAREDQHP
jgi:hypothetical protein